MFNKSQIFLIIMITEIFNVFAFDLFGLRKKKKTITKFVYEVCTTDAEYIALEDLNNQNVPIQYLTMV